MPDPTPPVPPMSDALRQRILRRLERLSDERGYQILDYIEFLESKYGTGTRAPTPAERLGDTVEDTMRAIRIPGTAIRGTMGAVDAASRLMDRLAQAGKAAVDELGRTLSQEEEGPERPERPGKETPGHSA